MLGAEKKEIKSENKIVFKKIVFKKGKAKLHVISKRCEGTKYYLMKYFI